jgi:3-dehydroquinate synthase
VEAFDLSLRPAPREVCRVRVGAGALDALVEDLAQAPPGGLVVLVHDAGSAPAVGRPLGRRVAARGLRVARLCVPRGEAAKTRRAKAWVEDRLAALGAGSDTVLVAVGGGAVGDLTGFVAATWHRGVPVFQVPTTLLAMVDAALGGKTAINVPAGKNLVGAFHPPRGVYADLAALATLPDHRYREGFAEIVKCAAVADARLFRWLERNAGPLRARRAQPLERVVLRCLRLKASVVRGDERDRGRRAMLNFGHTVGHALEVATDGRLPHGPAVAAGMGVEARLARRTTGFPEGDRRRLEQLLAAFGLSPRWPRGVTPAAVVSAARRDKKNRAGRIHCALPLRLGCMPAGDRVSVSIEEAQLVSALCEFVRGARRPD